VKRILLSVFIGLLGLGFTVTGAEAKRLGGGLSQGMKRQAPPAQQAPATPPQQAQQPPAKPAATPGATAAAATPAAPAPRRSWLGPIAGLAAGLGIAALLSHFGLGEGFANVLTILLLVVAAVWVVRWALRRFAPARPAMRYADAGGNAMPWRQEPAFSGTTAPALESRPAPALANGTHALPAGIDRDDFERAAKTIFIRMQAANDAGDLDDLRLFSTPEMYAAFRLDLQDRRAPQRTDVVKLDADLVDAAVEQDRQIVSVRYHGLIREENDGVAQPFDEVWHLVRPADGSRSWAIAGIEQSVMH
jgi:predicted lipid-binding transport protein (Tim44 family)